MNCNMRYRYYNNCYNISAAGAGRQSETPSLQSKGGVVDCPGPDDSMNGGYLRIIIRFTTLYPLTSNR